MALLLFDNIKHTEFIFVNQSMMVFGIKIFSVLKQIVILVLAFVDKVHCCLTTIKASRMGDRNSLSFLSHLAALMTSIMAWYLQEIRMPQDLPQEDGRGADETQRAYGCIHLMPFTKQTDQDSKR